MAAGARRISFGEGRYSTPVWSPMGDFIAFTKQRGGNFAIGIIKPDGSGERILTEGFHNEGPSWAPNGRYIVFFRESGAGAKLHMVDITGRVDVPIPHPNFRLGPCLVAPALGTVRETRRAGEFNTSFTFRRKVARFTPSGSDLLG